jgi:uncharacterized short protein YbdD (DUF466 family)
MDFSEIKTIVMDAGINLLLGIIILVVGLFSHSLAGKTSFKQQTLPEAGPVLSELFQKSRQDSSYSSGSAHCC